MILLHNHPEDSVTVFRGTASSPTDRITWVIKLLWQRPWGGRRINYDWQQVRVKLNSRTNVKNTHKQQQQQLQECVPGKGVPVARGSGSAGSAGPSVRARARPRGESASLLKQTILKANSRVVILMRGVRVSSARADSPVRRARAGKSRRSQRNNHTERMNETYRAGRS